MITIQGFAKLYDRIGLLTPAKVDEWTGYRYYEEEQALLFVKIKNLQQADFSIEEIKTILPGDDELLTAAFERKIREQQQKLERIREIQRSYLKEKMDIQKLVNAIIGFVEGQLDNPALWEEFGISTDRRAELTAKAHAMLADMMAKNKETLETVTMTMDDQAVTGAENVIRVLNEEGERYCVFGLTEESAARYTGLPTMMLVMMASEMDELKGGVTCNTAPSKDGQNHFTLLYKKA